jgi:hypothetical protein
MLPASCYAFQPDKVLTSIAATRANAIGQRATQKSTTFEMISNHQAQNCQARRNSCEQEQSGPQTMPSLSLKHSDA